MLSQVVMNTELKHPGQPAQSSSTPPVPPVQYDVASVVLALKTLGTFNFDGS